MNTPGSSVVYQLTGRCSEVILAVGARFYGRLGREVVLVETQVTDVENPVTVSGGSTVFIFHIPIQVLLGC